MFTLGPGLLQQDSGDPYNGLVVLRLHFDGADGATSGPGYNDSSLLANTITRSFSGCTISTAQSKFGGSSLRCTSGGSSIYTPTFALVSDTAVEELTIETFIRFNSIGARKWICGTDDSGGSAVERVLALSLNASNQIEFSNRGITATITSSSTLTTGQWYHLAACWTATTVYLWIDGVLEASGASSNAGYDCNRAFNIGRLGEFTGTSFDGWLDEFRITRGKARYTSAFTPPTVAFLDA